MAATGESLTYRQMEERSNQAAQLFRALGLKPGDAVALFMENNLDFLPICWGAQRAGLYYTCISSRLTAGEVEYIVGDCNAKVLIVSSGLTKVASELVPILKGVKLLMVGGHAAGYQNFFGMAARHHTFHTPGDDLAATGPEILEPVARAFVAAARKTVERGEAAFR